MSNETKNSNGYTFAELYAKELKGPPRNETQAHATDAQQLQWANEDEAERKATADMNYPDDAHKWPLDPSASPARSNLEFYQRRESK